MSTIPGGDPAAPAAAATGPHEETQSSVPPQSALPPTAGQGILLRTRFFALDWTLNFTRTTVTIDGHLHERPWGQQFFPLEPGRHQLQVSYRYLRWSRAGKASILVDVAANQVVQVSYRAPRSMLVAFLPGKLAIEPRLEC